MINQENLESFVELYSVIETWRGHGYREGIYMYSSYPIGNSARILGSTFLFGEAPNGAREALAAARAMPENTYQKVYNEYDSLTVKPLSDQDPLFKEVLKSYGVSEVEQLAQQYAIAYRFDEEDHGICGPAELEQMVKVTIRQSLKDGTEVTLSSGSEKRLIKVDSSEADVDSAIKTVLIRFFGWRGDLKLTSGTVCLKGHFHF